MCYFADWTRPDLINLFIAVGTFLTAGFTWGLIRAANIGFKTVVSQEANRVQLELVGNLVNDILHAGITINGRQVKNWPFHAQVYNIFDFARTSLVNEDYNHPFYLSDSVFFKELKQVFSDIRNPLLPPVIANAIFAFPALGMSTVRKENHLTTPQYILGEEMLLHQNELEFIQFESHGGINDWLQICKNIQAAIFEWYKEKGIKEINVIALRLDKIP